MEFEFRVTSHQDLSPVPKHSGVYKIFDIHEKLIVLDKTSNLFQPFERYYGPRSDLAAATHTDAPQYFPLLPAMGIAETGTPKSALTKRPLNQSCLATETYYPCQLI